MEESIQFIIQTKLEKSFTNWEKDKFRNKVQWNFDNWTAGDYQTKFELWVMFPLCISHVAIVASPFHSSVFHFLAKLSEICDFLLMWKEKQLI